MEYFIINKNQKIPSLGYNFKSNFKKDELTYFQNYNALSYKNLIIYLDFENKNYINENKINSFYVAPFVNNINFFKNNKYNYNFIIINNIDKNILKYCLKNNIFPILFLEYFDKNLFFKNFKFLNNNLLIKLLIEMDIIVINNKNLNNFNFDIFIGDLKEIFIN